MLYASLSSHICIISISCAIPSYFMKHKGYSSTGLAKLYASFFNVDTHAF